ncbi:6-phospho-3-hexuloisomerase [Lacticaseibacillus paracasei]|uniref:6-phospho-3-hexuloisomerase n=1 Tax=Lacticaseibacillus paracasei TaxID=1597 RepID=UPI00325AC923
MEAKSLKTIIRELDQYAPMIDDTQVETVQANRIFIGGAGRSGFAGRGFAMRLMHLGLHAYFVGETTTPSIGEGDLLVIGSGSGSTGSLVVDAKKAKAVGAKLATVTIYPTAEIGSLADAIIAIPGETPKNETGAADTAHSVQPMGTLFEQLSWLTYDAIILELMKLTGETTDTMFPRHANLE